MYTCMTHIGGCVNLLRKNACVAGCCSVLQCVAVCCSVLQCVVNLWRKNACVNDM